MRIVMFYHSLISDWNHASAHFLRGVVTELLERGHDVAVYEPREGWSLSNLRANCGREAFKRFHKAYPHLRSRFYDPRTFEPGELLDDADLVIVHEWNDRSVIERVGNHRRRHNGYRLLFHDTHHRSVTAPEKMQRIDLSNYDGVLAFGSIIRDIYLERGWTDNAWTWHEAADTRVFRPRTHGRWAGDLAWIGNWDSNERPAKLREFLIDPTRLLRLKTTVHGANYPLAARQALAAAGVEYGGYIPNWNVPQVLTGHRLTMHVSRRATVHALQGIPNIRVFEALACGVPLICSPWDDSDGLFAPGEDYLVAQDGATMMQLIAAMLDDPDTASRIGKRGRETILAAHTCAHRVNELMSICRQLGMAIGRDTAADPLGIGDLCIAFDQIACNGIGHSDKADRLGHAASSPQTRRNANGLRPQRQPATREQQAHG